MMTCTKHFQREGKNKRLFAKVYLDSHMLFRYIVEQLKIKRVTKKQITFKIMKSESEALNEKRLIKLAFGY